MFVTLERSNHARALYIEAIVSTHNIITMTDLNGRLRYRPALVTATRALLEVWFVRRCRSIATL